MKEREPKWYEEARNGPFRESRFTDAAADKVIMRVRSGAPGPERAGQKLRRSFIAAAVILLLAVAGAILQQKGLLGEGRQAGLFYQEVKTPDLTDAGFRKTAERVMQEQLGKKLSFVGLERMDEAKQAAIIFRAGEDAATVWISTETGQVLRMYMNASFLPGEADANLLRTAKKTIQEIGYPREFKISRVQRFVQSGLKVESGIQVQVQDSFIGNEGQIDFLNRKFDRAVFNVSLDLFTEEVNQIGLKALQHLRTKGTDRLIRVTRNIGGGKDELVLDYRQGDLSSSFFTMGSVTMDYYTHAVKGMSDMSLFIPKSQDSGQLAEQDQKLLNMDDAKLQDTAAAVVNGVFGIRLQEYKLEKNMKTPGIVTFRSVGKKHAIKVSYNLDGAVYNVQEAEIS
ncbi:hypothetical protein [Paenibacillus sp. P32E]|uniref:hypothetical protein n=1 Tax=Paenibacillus sp. P32E TaxID=1349434 RepID=UPI00093A984E|nr:hypothetical protein [Paenibacillus sp. P32E]OKP92933.1 hypothetical protein A3848_06015 [Paenibacillus sp. P32E]